MKEYVYIYKDKIIFTSDKIENLTDLVRYAMETTNEVIKENEIKYYKRF